MTVSMYPLLSSQCLIQDTLSVITLHQFLACRLFIFLIQVLVNFQALPDFLEIGEGFGTRFNLSLNLNEKIQLKSCLQVFLAPVKTNLLLTREKKDAYPT